jgi:ribosomal protein S8E
MFSFAFKHIKTYQNTDQRKKIKQTDKVKGLTQKKKKKFLPEKGPHVSGLGTRPLSTKDKSFGDGEEDFI